jgi:CDP-glucose 4,6-dehydratase
VVEGDQPHETAYLNLDISKARDRLNWHPILGLSDALNLVVDWTRQSQSGMNVRTLTEQQITSYQKLVQTS